VPPADHRPRWWLGLALIAVLAGCSSAASSSARPTTTPATLGCAWYSPIGTSGLVVNVTATGPACAGHGLVTWVAADTRRQWSAESLIPGSFGTLLAAERRAGSAVWVYFTGAPDQQAAPVAGQLADDLQAAGWSPSP
jgi:hypothetical protein